MSKKESHFLRIIHILPFLFITLNTAFPADYRDVVINEIAWMGTEANTADEWIELYNSTGSAIDITGWTLMAADSTPLINLSGTIPAYGYFLLERTDDQTISDISADQIYKNAMNNDGEKILLKDNTGKIIDEVDCSSGWFAGSNSTKSSMERVHPSTDGSSPGSWGTNDGITKNGKDSSGNDINGTPKSENSVYDGSLAVTLLSFTGSYSDEGITLHWRTASEVDLLGFLIYRSISKNGTYNKITPSMIPASGYGTDYDFIDRNFAVNEKNWYRIEFKYTNDKREYSDPICVEVRTEAEPCEIELFPNYPNPFNPSTKIRFSISGLEQSKRVVLKIYGITGREIKTIFDRISPPAGNYTIEWNGTDKSGMEVSSGVYFYRLIVDGRVVLTKKMIKIK